MPREKFGVGQESLRSGGPAGSNCPPRPSEEVRERLLSGRAGTDQIILKTVPNVPVVQNVQAVQSVAAVRGSGRLRSDNPIVRSTLPNSLPIELGSTYFHFAVRRPSALCPWPRHLTRPEERRFFSTCRTRSTLTPGHWRWMSETRNGPAKRLMAAVISPVFTPLGKVVLPTRSGLILYIVSA